MLFPFFFQCAGHVQGIFPCLILNRGGYMIHLLPIFLMQMPGIERAENAKGKRKAKGKNKRDGDRAHLPFHRLCIQGLDLGGQAVFLFLMNE